MNTKKKKLPIGVSDFKKMISEDYYYIDKSLFIEEILEKGETIILLPRPRRFGKTLNLSMLKYFYDCCPDPEAGIESEREKIGVNKEPFVNPYKKLFDSLAISKSAKEHLDKMGKHPVIFLTFKDIKEIAWEISYRKIKQLIQDEYLRHDYLLNSPKLKSQEKDYFKRIIDLKGEREEFENSLQKLLIFLSRFYGERVVILIDEYDAPIHMGFSRGYYDDIINFMRNFLSGGLKDTDKYLEKGIVTGIMRVAKESIFSGLNNPGVFTLTAEEFDDKFGFTPDEIEKLLEDFDSIDYFDDIRKWYNGYRFGARLIYNPWSILNFLASKSKRCQPFWINTSDNEIVEDLLSMGGKELKGELELLVRGETIEKVIEEDIVLKDVKKKENLLWSFLLMGGYLKYTSWRQDKYNGWIYYTLAIPNMEVRTTYTRIIDHYFTTKIENENVQLMLNSLIQGDIKLFEKMLRSIVLGIFSYHDFGGEPERVYHALVLGMLVWMAGTHEIKSNRESGYGRYDIMIIPRDLSQTGYVIEFKTVDIEEKETPKSALAAAMKQIEEKKYETELKERGIKKIIKLAIAFRGKEVFLESKG